MFFRRPEPSPRYRLMEELYRRMHHEGEPNLQLPPDRTFSGHSLRPHIKRIKTLIEVLSARSLLDYGAGKGALYRERPLQLSKDESVSSLQAYWGLTDLALYDPGVPEISALPSSRFDAVITIDVLEHCPEEDLPWIIEEIFAIARDFVYLNVASYPANKRLPNGENAHITQQPAGWWQRLFDQAVAGRPGLRYYASIISMDQGIKKEQMLRGKGPLS